MEDGKSLRWQKKTPIRGGTASVFSKNGEGTGGDSMVVALWDTRKGRGDDSTRLKSPQQRRTRLEHLAGERGGWVQDALQVCGRGKEGGNMYRLVPKRGDKMET